MQIVIKKVEEVGEIIEVENTLNVFQKIVNGYIEIFRLTDEIAIVLNEEGKLFELDVNFGIPCDDGSIEVIVGDVAFVRINNEDFSDLLDEDIDFLRLIGIL